MANRPAKNVDQFINKMNDTPPIGQLPDTIKPPSQLEVNPMANGLESVTVSHGKDFRATLADIMAGPNGLNNLGVCVQRTVSHQMSNVADATLSAWIRTEQLGHKASNPKDMSDSEKNAITNQIKEWRKANPDVCDEKIAEIRKTQWDTILTGKMSLTVRGPRRDPIEVEFDNLVLQEATAQLFRFTDVNGTRFTVFPTSDDTVLTFAARDASGQHMTRTRAQMLDNVKAKKGDELRARAEEIVALRNAKSTTTEPVESLEEAGI